ncbi:hypothetical protein C1H76_9596 [Elsinoe australis]|uniref:Secreted protein n=1 Tax=Elsinoe australis TaxID=40998 RepID=A0A4U7AJM6_9PEZI|nr:hypothetical protein C1H76_9596 [Elsinoe australis]
MKGFLIFIALLGLSSAVPVKTRGGASTNPASPGGTPAPGSSPLSSAPPSPPPAGNIPTPPTGAVQQGIGGKQVVNKNPPNAAPADIAVSQHQAIDAATAPSKNPLTSTSVIPPQPGVPNGMAPTASTDKKQQEVSQQFKDASAQSATQLNDVLAQREGNNNRATDAKPKVDPRKPVSMIHTEDATTLATKQNLPPGQQIPGDNSGSVIGKTGSWGKGGASFVPNCGTSGTGQQKIDPSCAQVTQGNQAAGNEQINWQTPGQVPQGSKDALDQYNQQKKQG